MINEVKRGTWLAITAAVILIAGGQAVVEASTIYENFDDGNADGWSLLYPTGTWSMSFPDDPYGGKYLKMTGQQSGGASVYLKRDQFAFDTSNIVVQFDFKVLQSGYGSPTGSSCVQPEQWYNANNYAFDTLRWGYYNDMYSRRCVGGNLSAGGNYPYPTALSDRSVWTRFLVEWNDDLATVSYRHPLIPNDPWVRAYSYHNGNGNIPLGAMFRFGLVSVPEYCEFGLDNILVTPEPATLSLLAISALGLLKRRR